MMLRQSTKDTARIRNVRQKLDGLKKLLDEHNVTDVFTYRGYEILIDCLIKDRDVISQSSKLEAQWREIYFEIINYVAHTLTVEITERFRMIEPRDYFEKGVREKISKLSLQHVNQYLEDLMDIVPVSLNKASFTFDKEKQILEDNVLGLALTLEFWVRVADVCYRKKSPPNLAVVNAILVRLCPNDIQSLIIKLVSENAQTMFNRMKTFTVLNPEAYSEKFSNSNVIPVFFFLEAKTERLDEKRSSALPYLDETEQPNKIHAPRYEMVQLLKNNISKLPIIYSKSKDKLFKTLHNHISGGVITRLNLSAEGVQTSIDYKNKLIKIKKEDIDVPLHPIENFDNAQILETKKAILEFRNNFTGSENDQFVDQLYTNNVYEITENGLAKLIDPMNTPALKKVLASTFKMRINVEFFNPILLNVKALDEKAAHDLDLAISRADLFAVFLKFLTKSEKAAYLIYLCEGKDLFGSKQSLFDALICDFELPLRIKKTLWTEMDSIINDKNSDLHMKNVLIAARARHPNIAKSEDILDPKKSIVTRKLKERKLAMEVAAEAKASEDIDRFNYQYKQFKNDAYIDQIYENEDFIEIKFIDVDPIEPQLMKVMASTFKIANDIEFLNPKITGELDADAKKVDNAIGKSNLFIQFLKSLSQPQQKAYLLFLCREKFDALPMFDDIIKSDFIPARIKKALVKVLADLVNDKNLPDDNKKNILLAAYNRFQDNEALEEQNPDILDVKKSEICKKLKENIRKLEADVKKKERAALENAEGTIIEFNMKYEISTIEDATSNVEKIYENLDLLITDSILTKVMASTMMLRTNVNFFNPTLTSNLDKNAKKIDIAIARSNLFIRFLNSLSMPEKIEYMLFLCTAKDDFYEKNHPEERLQDPDILLDTIIADNHVPDRLKVALLVHLSDVVKEKNIPLKYKDTLRAARNRLVKAKAKFESRLYPIKKGIDTNVPSSNDLLDIKKFKINGAIAEKKRELALKNKFLGEDKQKKKHRSQSSKNLQPKESKKISNQNRSLPSTPEQKRARGPEATISVTPERQRAHQCSNYYTSQAYADYLKASEIFMWKREGTRPVPPPLRTGRGSKPQTPVLQRDDSDQIQNVSYVSLTKFAANNAKGQEGGNQAIDPVTRLFNQLLALNDKCIAAIDENSSQPDIVKDIITFQKSIAKMIPNTLNLQGNLNSEEKLEAFGTMKREVEEIQEALDVLSNSNAMRSSYLNG